jgi:thiol-disulfide isomerase/thioredoxin
MTRQKMNFRTWRSVLFVFGAGLMMCAPGVSMDPPRAVLVLKDASGERVRLSDYRGKVVVLNFWATWCGPCRDEIPMLVEMEKEYSSRGVVFIGASLDDERTSRQIPDYLARYGVKYPVWYGAGRGDLDRLGFDQAVPATAFLDQEGRVGARVLGEIRRREIKDRLDWLLGDWTGPAPQALVNHLGSFSGAR